MVGTDRENMPRLIARRHLSADCRDEIPDLGKERFLPATQRSRESQVLALGSCRCQCQRQSVAGFRDVAIRESDAVLGGQPSRPDSLLERLVISFCLVRIGPGEAGKRPVSNIPFPEEPRKHGGAG